MDPYTRRMGRSHSGDGVGGKGCLLESARHWDLQMQRPWLGRNRHAYRSQKKLVDRVPRGKKWISEYLQSLLSPQKVIYKTNPMPSGPGILTHLCSIWGDNLTTNLVTVLISPSLWAVSYGLSSLSTQHFTNLPQNSWPNLGSGHISPGPLK